MTRVLQPSTDGFAPPAIQGRVVFFGFTHMHHTAAIIASLASLGLVCIIYYANILSGPRHPLRSEMLGMILLALLTGLFPLAVVAALIGLSAALTGGISFAAVLAAGTDLLAILAILATGLVFRALVKATYRDAQGVPRVATPPAPANAGRPPRKAA